MTRSGGVDGPSTVSAGTDVIVMDDRIPPSAIDVELISSSRWPMPRPLTLTLLAIAAAPSARQALAAQRLELGPVGCRLSLAVPGHGPGHGRDGAGAAPRAPLSVRLNGRG